MPEPPIADARRAHAVVAACLDDPALLQRWSRRPSTLRTELGEHGAIAMPDVRRLRAFSGFVTKVRQNPVRQRLPTTFRALAATGLELDLFADYARRYVSLRARRPLSEGARLEAFLAYLRGWLDPTTNDHALVWDIVRHELRTTAATDGAGARSSENFYARPAPSGVVAIPRMVGPVYIERMTCDPRRAVERLQGPRPRLDDLARGEYLFAYFRVPNQEDVRVLELEPLEAYVLSLIDGRRTVEAIAKKLARLGRRPVVPREVFRVLGRFRASGLVRIDGPTRSRRRATCA